MKQGDPGYWEWRKNTGRKKNIRNSKHLWQLACDYFADSDSRPIEVYEQRRGKITVIADSENEEAFNKAASSLVAIPRKRAYSWMGFEAYLSEQNILQNLEDYRYNKEGRYDEFAGVIRAIEQIMRAQNFEGVNADEFNPSIMARYLNLVDRQELTHKEQPIFGDDPDEDA